MGRVKAILDDEMLDLAERRGLYANNATAWEVLVDAPPEQTAAALKKITKSKTWTKNVFLKKVKTSKRSFVVYRLKGHGWTIVEALSGPAVETELASQLAKELSTRAMWFCVEDTSSWLGYHLYDAKGRIVELLESFGDHHGDASHLPKSLLGKLAVKSTGRGIFGSSLRKVTAKTLGQSIAAEKLMDDLFREEEMLVPVGAFDGGRAGQSIKLDLPDIGKADIERMDFIG